MNQNEVTSLSLTEAKAPTQTAETLAEMNESQLQEQMKAEQVEFKAMEEANQSHYESQKETNQTDSLVSPDSSHIGDILSELETEEKAQQKIDAQEEKKAHVESVQQAGVLTKTQFCDGVSGVLNMTSSLTKIKSLHVENQEIANGCFESIYDYATEIPWLRFMIEPQNVHAQRMIQIGAFVVPMTLSVRAELKARKAEKAEVSGNGVHE